MSLPTVSSVPSPEGNSALIQSLGALEIGILFAFALTGATLMQFYVYQTSNFSHDALYVKMLTYYVVILELAHSAFVAAYLYTYTIRFFGDTEKLLFYPWTLMVSIPISGWLAAPIQWFFAWRAYGISKKWSIFCITILISFIRLCCTISVAALGSGQEVNPWNRKFKWLVALSILGGVVTDVINTFVLTFSLYRAKGRVISTRHMLDKITVWTLESGLATTAMNVLSLILFFALPDSAAYLSVTTIFAKVYSNSLFAMLNGRISLRASRPQGHISLHTGSRGQVTALARRADGGTHVQVEMNRTVLKVGDDPSAEFPSDEAGFAKGGILEDGGPGLVGTFDDNFHHSTV